MFQLISIESFLFLSCVLYILSRLTHHKRFDNLPVIGYAWPTLGRLESLARGEQNLYRAFRQQLSNDQPYNLRGIFGDSILLPPSMLQWILSQPDSHLSAKWAQLDALNILDTFLRPEIGMNPVHEPLVRRNLTAHLDQIAGHMWDEVGLALEDLSGALVTMLGLYVPFIILGTAVGTIGAGLILMLDLNTSTALWAVFLVVCAVGTGFAINLPYTVAQAVLTEDQVPTGNAALQFLFQFGAAISLSIGQTIFLNQLKLYARVLTPSIPDSVLVSAGAYNLRSLTDSEQVYNLLRQVYMKALHDSYIYPVVAAGVALLTTFAIENKNIKKIDKDREDERDAS